MRVKSYLKTRGVEFDPVDARDEGALAELRARGIKGLPVVTKGDRHALGLDLAQIDALLGLISDAEARELPERELFDRARRLLRAAARFARQLPPAHYDDLIPGMGAPAPYVLPDGHILVLPSGKPYEPHRTYGALVRHIVSHAIKFKRVVENPDADYSSAGDWVQLGEPDDTMGVARCVEQLESVAEKTLGWQAVSDRDLGYVMKTFIGPQTLHQMLQREDYSLAQHTRQLMSVLLDLGIAPDGPIGEAEYAGLQMPKEVWG